MDYKAVLAIAAVALQFGVQPYVNEFFLSPTGIKSVIVIIQEIFKSCCCILLLIVTGDLRGCLRGLNFQESCQVALLPSIIYSIQNILAFYAYQNLDPLIFNLINQSKVIFAAVFLYFVLNIKQSRRQLIALLILFSVSIMLTYDTSQQMKTSNENDSKNIVKDGVEKNEFQGLVGVIVASMLSGIAGTLVQKALQAQGKPRNTLLYSTELAFFSVIFLGLRLCVEGFLGILDGGAIVEKGWSHGLDWRSMIPIATSSIGGIGIGYITKYAGVIAKSYALIGAILLSGIIRWLFYYKPMSKIMFVAVPLVMLSLWLKNDPNAKKKSDKEKQKKKKKQ